LVISFLARLAGLGKGSDAVVNLVKAVQAKVDQAIDFAINWIVTKAKSLLARLLGKGKDKKDERTEDEKLADLKSAMYEANSVLKETGISHKKILTKLTGIKAKYKMTSLELVIDSQTGNTETVRVLGKINPEDTTDEAEVTKDEPDPTREPEIKV